MFATATSHASNWPFIFTAVSACAAAVAAITACVTVILERRDRQRAREPELAISPATLMDRGNQVRLTIENSGGGTARDVHFLLVEGGFACSGGLPPTGLLSAGRAVVMATGLVSSPGQQHALGVVTCRFGPYRMAWDAAGRHHRVHLDRTPGISDAMMWRHFYPDAPTIEDVELVGCQLESEIQAGSRT